MNTPPLTAMKQVAPLDMWQRAERQAMRSALPVRGVGAVVFDKRGRILSTGTAHAGSAERWIHAEEHACSRMWPALDSLDATCLIVTLSRKSGSWSYSSCPCARCMNFLVKFNIKRVIYMERLDDGLWQPAVLTPSDFEDQIAEHDLTKRYAKHMRLLA